MKWALVVVLIVPCFVGCGSSSNQCGAVRTQLAQYDRQYAHDQATPTASPTTNEGTLAPPESAFDFNPDLQGSELTQISELVTSYPKCFTPGEVSKARAYLHGQ